MTVAHIFDVPTLASLLFREKVSARRCETGVNWSKRAIHGRFTVNGAYLVWRIINQFSMLGNTVSSDTIGVTLFKFSEDARIMLQQDFWDSPQGCSQNIPVPGSVLRAIRGRCVN